MNYMSEVAKMFGVELGEEFELKSPNDSCYTLAMFTDDGLKIIETNVSDQCFWKPYALEHLLKGTYTIKRKPWKPKLHEHYYFIDEEGYVYSETWDNQYPDIIFYKLGNCYKTYEEAEANSAKWVAFYKSDEVLEV